MRKLVLGLLLVACDLDNRELASVRADAVTWATQMGLKASGASCSSRDSEADGYVSCSVATEDGEVHALECSWLRTGACRQVNTMKVRRR